MTMKLPNDFDHFWEGSKKPKSCPWTLQKSCWQLLSIIPGDQTLLARYCKKANTLQSSRSSPGKKVLIGHRCSHPGDGGKKIGDPSPVHMRPSTKVAIQNDGNLSVHGCPPKVAIQNNGNLGPLASRSKKRQYSSKQLQGIQLLWEDIVSTRTYINLYNVCGSFLKKQGYNVHLNI